MATSSTDSTHSQTPLRAIVKCALSGSSIVLRGRPGPEGQPPRERTLYLAHLTAPKMGNKERADEIFAFESREALRTLVVGREVTFSLAYTIPAQTGPPLEFGDVLIPSRENLDVAKEMVDQGWAKVKEDRRSDAEDPSERKYELRALEVEARNAGRGLWATEKPAIRSVRQQAPVDLQSFLLEHKGKVLDGIVEQTSNGSSMRVRLLLDQALHQIINVQLAGTRAPRASSANHSAASDGAETNGANVGEEFGDEAHFFTSSRLLQRNIQIQLLAVPPGASGPNASFIATVQHPAGSIAALLLREGLAKCQDVHAGLLGAQQMSVLRKAEAEARTAQRGVWTHTTGVKPLAPITNGHAQTSTSYDALVVRVWGGDTLSVRKGKNGEGEEVRVQLASVRQTKQSDPKLAGLLAEAREVLRKRTIGKVVRVNVDYKRPAEQNWDAKDCATVFLNGNNIAIQLVERGLVGVIRHRRDDEDRSSDIDSLMQAEAKAISENRGLHSGKEFPLPRTPDASESTSKAQSFLAGLKRSGRIPAVVDFILAGSRFKLIIPKQDIKIMLVLSGIRVPRTARDSQEKGEPYAQEAYDFAMRKAMQRDVEITVADVAQSGGFIGALWLNKTENLAVALVREGLSTVHEHSAANTAYGAELTAAEEEAKRAKRNIWSTFDLEAEAAAKAARAEAAAPPSARTEYVDILLSDLRPDPFSVSIQILRDGGIPELERLMADFALHHQSDDAPKGFQPRVGDLVSAKFSEDSQWYRAKVRKVTLGKRSADVVFHDYGNTETVSFDSLRPLPDQFRNLPGQAHEAVPSFIKLAGFTSDYGQEAVERFRSLTEGRPLVANIDYREPGAGGRLHLTLYDPANPASRDSAKSINAELVREGLAFLDRKCRYVSAYPQVVQVLRAAHQEARSTHAGALRYGDIEDDDD